jgi:uncharacterized membrane protein
MNNRNTTLIATIVAAVLCGCPGLFGLCFGLTSVFASFVPNAQIDVFGSSDPQSATTMGLAALCLSVLALAVPVVVWFVMRRRENTAVISDHEPLPPAG